MLHDQQRPALQLIERDVGLVDGGWHPVRDVSPLGRWQVIRLLLPNLHDDRPVILLVDVDDATQLHPAVCLLRTLGAHLGNQDVLQPQMDGQQVDLLDIGSAYDAFSRRLNDNVDPMRRAPQTQPIELGPTLNASDETSVVFIHRVLAVRRRAEQFML